TRNSSVCYFDPYGSFLFYGNIEKESIDSLVQMLPDREDEIREAYVKAQNNYSTISSLAENMLMAGLDQEKLSEEVKSALGQVTDTVTKEYVEAMHPDAMPYSDIGRMLTLVTDPSTGIGPEHFESVYSAIINRIDDKYTSLPFDQAMRAFKEDSCRTYGLASDKITSVDILIAAFGCQPVAVADNNNVIVYDESGLPTETVLKAGDELNRLMEPIVKIDDKQLMKIRYADRDGFKYGYTML
ncbi:MAG: hypothetical protein WC490_08135, partial [Candidatus Margulisiibacteriota bacterium]